MTFYQRLRFIQRKSNSLLCIGLDSDIRKIPRSLLKHRNPIYEFNKKIISATKDLVCAYKTNLAFYEAIGKQGWETMHRTLALIPDDVLTIGDAKRGDIGTTAEFYAKSLMVDHTFDACTVNPYMGEDSVLPFLKNKYQGAFILALTSNPGANDFQYLNTQGRPLYEHVISKARKWNSKKNCGLVIGATRPKDLKRARKLAPEMPILIPGIGAQAGNVELAVRYGCDGKGELAILNAGRSILYASHQADFAKAARAAALKLRDEINSYRGKLFS
jgi:orotidine-5'-phosphate decarboxylase